ncbi:hypothetical protein CD191_08930 [Paenibacillus odorifer]|uniref:Uncharacterized protein n=1 Tax=Paenibacillus odorifer TaxID=189426 RepID=A0AAD0P341_9BACL|nr:hypothetical protein CD191_08930 [Paenibacillus odorifer]
MLFFSEYRLFLGSFSPITLKRTSHITHRTSHIAHRTPHTAHRTPHTEHILWVKVRIHCIANL